MLRLLSLVLVFSSSGVSSALASGIENLRELPRPSNACLKMFNQMKNRMDQVDIVRNTVETMTAEQQSAYALIKLLVDQRFEGEGVAIALQAAELYPNLFDGSNAAKNSALALSDLVHRHWASFPAGARPAIEYMNDHVLAHISNEVRHINIFQTEGYSRFIELASDLPTDDEGRAVFSEDYRLGLDLFNEHLDAMDEVYVQTMSYLSEQAQTVVGELRRSEISIEDARVMQHRLVILFNEVQTDLETQQTMLFRAFPSPSVTTERRVDRRRQLIRETRGPILDQASQKAVQAVTDLQRQIEARR